ncbi:aminoacyl-histidine dipeptidase [Chitinophaga nivalis]|uniref:Aminoacyl-histidine dipeptidase n=1 Tax=Chitinophaga nivalis TaxID=2991709 RepID=A0ABT3IM86_9BACT|nr:aminoacyl-histidine dipeptidase [Chitinophaga nivalis]MCW3465219.1 aminoacyl-histidine dipeptidase [Chitinophaga nivalis]MCW3485089.1 aminoacyl-histidine dipeptidase [Chitinophaga nivalis]
MELKDLSPQILWKHFAALNAVPRASKKEERVIAFMLDFGKSLGLETRQDAIGNVVIKKPATPGMENRQTVILQSHLDMVHQKNGDTVFDFDTQGIDMYVDGEWVKARGTTLGADNGIGVAAIMSVLASTDLVHPALEAMFTIDEETGMTGAKQLDPANFTGTVLLNLDTEEEDELTIGCAGGIDTNTTGHYQEVPVAAGAVAFDISIKGLVGGHSGMDIHRGRANANKLMNRLLYKATQSVDLQLAQLDGGSLRNAIPRESKALVVVPEKEKAAFEAFFAAYTATVKDEYKAIEANLTLTIAPAALPAKVMDPAYLKQVLRAIYAAPNGVFRMSPDIANLVEASSNLAKVTIKDGVFITQSLQRSSVESSKEDVAFAVGAAFESIGCEVARSGDYPGWQPRADAAILQLMLRLYNDHFTHEPHVGACHAGLECGILGGHLGKLDMISFGPTIRGAHSPDERVLITSVDKFYGYLLHILREIPVK